MSELDPEDLALLDAARGAERPTAGDRARVQRRLVARLGAAAFGVSATTTAASAAAGVSLSAAAKMVVGVVVVAALGAGGVAVHRAREETAVAASAAPRAPVRPSARTSERASTPPSRPTPAPVEDSPAPARAAPAPSSEIALAPPAPAPRRAKAARAVAPPPAPAPSGSASTLDDELSLLAAADAALRDGDGARALGMVDAHARRFPKSALREEREVVRVLALCAAGRTAEARAASDALLRAHPASPYAARLRASCAFP